MFLAFLPAALSGVAPGAAWRIAHSMFFVFHASVFIWFFRHARQLALPISRVGYVPIVVGFGVLLGEASVALGFVSQAAPHLYLLALLWFLFLAAIAFIALVFPQYPRDGPAA